jgi:hypothetical protein
MLNSENCSMKIATVTYSKGLAYGLVKMTKVQAVTEILNNVEADFILFPGHSLNSLKDLEKVAQNITAPVNALLEVKEMYVFGAKRFNNLFMARNGVVRNMHTSQLFSTSSEIQGNRELAEWLLTDLEQRRGFSIIGKRFLVLDCGENNILRNVRSDGNRARFRFDDDKELATRFEAVINNTDIVLNPTHTALGELGVMTKRMAWLSENERYYFTTTNAIQVIVDHKTGETKRKLLSLDSKILHYAFHNGEEIELVCEPQEEKKPYRIEYYDVK